MSAMLSEPAAPRFIPWNTPALASVAPAMARPTSRRTMSFRASTHLRFKDYHDRLKRAGSKVSRTALLDQIVNDYLDAQGAPTVAAHEARERMRSSRLERSRQAADPRSVRDDMAGGVFTF